MRSKIIHTHSHTFFYMHAIKERHSVATTTKMNKDLFILHWKQNSQTIAKYKSLLSIYYVCCCIIFCAVLWVLEQREYTYLYIHKYIIYIFIYSRYLMPFVARNHSFYSSIKRYQTHHTIYQAFFGKFILLLR